MRWTASWRRIATAGALLAAAAAAHAQLLPPVPDVGGTLGKVDRVASDALGRGADAARTSARELLAVRQARLRDLVRTHPERLEMTEAGPAVRSEVIAIDADAATLAAVERAGFDPLGEEEIEGLGIRATTLRVPRGWSVDRALSRLRRIAPDGEFAANHLHSQSGAAAATGARGPLAQAGRVGSASVGIVDGGVGAHPSLRGPIQQRGFARGAPRASAHATAIASLIAGEGSVRGAAPGTPLLVADVYGDDPAGGSATALARALGWMVEQRAAVVAVSLVGPSNPLVARAVAQARARGVHVVAAVGNDGPAAPPAYPASYPGVIAVTGVDGRGRVLIEAGRSLHLDYGAPGADMAAAGADGRLTAVRGTSYAVPLVAGRLAVHARAARPIAALDAEAARGRNVGRGIVCGDCRTPLRRD